MVMIALLALLAAQAAPVPATPQAPAPVPLRCALVTPRGDNVSFILAGWSDQEEFVDLFPEQGSIWPGRTLPGARNIMQGPAGAGRMFAFGSGNGVALEVSDTGGVVRSAILFRRDRQRPSLPLAYGFCTPDDVSVVYRPVDPQANAADIGADIAAFDPAQWPQGGCSLLLSDGRRMPFHFNVSATGDYVELSSPTVWAGRAISVRQAWARTQSGRTVSMFERRGGPRGGDDLVIDEPSHLGVKLIQLLDLGDPAAANQRGFAICGYSGLQRRPNLEMDMPVANALREGRSR